MYIVERWLWNVQVLSLLTEKFNRNLVYYKTISNPFLFLQGSVAGSERSKKAESEKSRNRRSRREEEKRSRKGSVSIMNTQLE